MENIEKIKPSGIFTNYIFKSIPLAFDESLSYYETLCGLLKMVKDQNKVINQNADALIELQDYVTHYFDNLDVQEEINNKLDEMVESGTLQEIIASYLNANALWCFDNVDDMQDATNLIDGSFAKTLGFYEKNDGGSALYKIRNITNDDVIDNMTIIEMLNDNSLIAELITPTIVTPEILGAYGDNVHDDTLSLKLIFSGIYKNVILNKTYKINEKLIINNELSIAGNGIIKVDFNNGNIIEINADNTIIKDITIEGNSSNDSSNYGAIRCDNKTNIIIDNVTIKNVHSCGISFTGCANSIINNCKIINTYATGVFMGGNGTNNNTISNNIIDTNRTQNGIFITASPTSASTTDYIYNNKIINNVVNNSNDTAIESGIHSVGTIICNNKASNSNNPLILLRDTKECKVYNNYLNATSCISAIAITPQTENASTWNNEASIFENVIEGHFTRAGISTQQSGVIIKDNLIKETDTGVRAIMFGGSLNNIELINNKIEGTYTYSIDFNYGGTDITLSNIKINESVDLLKINNYKTTFTNSNIKLKNNIITKATFARYAGETLFKILQGNFATFRINIKSSEGEEYAIFNLVNGTPTTIFNTSNIFFVSTGFSGWAITTNPNNTNNIIITRRGVDVTDVIIDYEISNV